MLYLFQTNASCHSFFFVPVSPMFLAEIILVYLKYRDHQYSRLVATVLKCISAGQSGHAFVIRIWPWDNKIVLITLVLIIYSLLSKTKDAGDENLGNWGFPHLLFILSHQSSFIHPRNLKRQANFCGWKCWYEVDEKAIIKDINLSKPHCHSLVALYIHRELRGHLLVWHSSARGPRDLCCFSPVAVSFWWWLCFFYAMYTALRSWCIWLNLSKRLKKNLFPPFAHSPHLRKRCLWYLIIVIVVL